MIKLSRLRIEHTSITHKHFFERIISKRVTKNYSETRINKMQTIYEGENDLITKLYKRSNDKYQDRKK